MRTPLPKPGQQVHLVLHDSVARWSYHRTRPTWVLDGVVADRFWWEPDKSCFCLYVVGDEVPTRVIWMEQVISINGEMVQGWDKPLPSTTRTWMVESASTRGEFYTVTFDGQHWGCNCKGFKFNNRCHHIREVQEKEQVHV
jgi:hypothetical protein